MPLKLTPSGDIPFLTTYQPYSLPVGTTVVEELKDMITYDLQPSTTSTIVDYSIGTDKSYSTTLTVKNITTNTKINMEVSFDKNIFIVDRVNVTLDNEVPLSVELQPNQTEQFIIKIKNGVLDQKISYQPEQTQIKMKIENMEMGDVVLRDVTTSVFTKQVLPETITLD